MLHTAKVGLGQSVAVFGVGGVGLSAIAAAAIAGADPIIAVDLVDRKLQFVREFGATHGINASNTDPVKAIWAGASGPLGATEPETDFPLFLEWVREGKFPLGKLVTDRYSLDQIEEARVALEEGRILGRAIIEM